MAWDIQVEGESGDLVFSPARDLAGVEGLGLLQQRISLRCKIPQGTWTHDRSGTLGSTLHLTHNNALAQEEDVRAAVTDALAPMTDEITITKVNSRYNENNQLQVEVEFVPILTEPDVPTVDTASPPDVDAVSVVIPQD